MAFYKKKIIPIVIILISVNIQAQVANTKVIADIKNELGPNCTQVTVVKQGTTEKEWVNNTWVYYHRVPVHITLQTEMQGVTRQLKGNAWYEVNGSVYTFKKYNPGTATYVGLPHPDTDTIRKFIVSLPDYGMGGKANTMTEVHEFYFHENPITWHTLLSVSIPVDVVYTYKKNNTTLEKVKEPFEVRLYRDQVNSAWNQVSFITPDAASDSRKKEILGTENKSDYQMSQIKTVLEKGLMQQSEAHFKSLPDVDIPNFQNMQDFVVWINQVLREENQGKAEKLLLKLWHPSQFNPVGQLYPDAQQMMDLLKKAVQNDFSTYADQYCETLRVKSQTNQTVEWWNKDQSKSCRCSILQENGKWYITELRIYIWESFMPVKAQQTTQTNCP